MTQPHAPDEKATPAPKASVLLVDDNPANLIALAAVLKPLNADLVEAVDGQTALAQLAERDFAVVLLDVQMPGMDGFEVAKRMRTMDRGRELPILFLTALHNDPTYVKKGYAVGAADYITKPFDVEIVRARVKAFVDLFEQREAVRRAQVAIRTEERDEAMKKLVAYERIATAALVTQELSGFLREICAVFMGTAETADCVCVLIREGDVLKEEAYFGLAEEPASPTVIPVGEGFAGQIAAQNEPAEIAGAAKSDFVKSAWIKARGTNGLYGVPLVDSGDVVGVAFIGSRTAEAFPEQEKRLFAALAQRAGWAIGQHRQRTKLFDLERKARREAEEASRMKDEFLATVSHELRSPLNAILGWTVTARAKAPPELEKALAIIERNARAQARIVEDVLDVSRIVSGKLRLSVAETGLASVVDRAIEGVRHAADAKRIDIVVSVDANVVLFADGQRLQQIMWNLLSNAIKFSPNGGRVDVEGVVEAEEIRLTVRDRGEGISAAFLPYVFESFRQEDSSSSRRHGGLGLGLSIVKQIVAAHGGEVRADSEGQGTGATFTVRLPLRARVEPGSAPAVSGITSHAPSDEEPFRLEGLRILVVDDDDDARRLLEDVLKDRGAEVAHAGSARDGFDELVRFRPDLLVSDIAMPGGDGYGFIRAVRALPQDRGGFTPAIAVTAHARDTDAERAIAAGFQATLPKPLDLERLIGRIHALTRGALPISTRTGQTGTEDA